LKKSGRYFFLSLTLAFMLTSLAGCVAPGPKSHSGLNYKNPPRPQLEKYSGDKVALDSNEAPILNSPPEMTGAELERAGDILFGQGNLHMASVKYVKSLKLDPDNTRILYKIGRLFVIGRLNADAVQVFEEVLKREYKKGDITSKTKKAIEKKLKIRTEGNLTCLCTSGLHVR